MRIEFSKPLEFENKKYSGIDINIENIKGKDIRNDVKSFKSLHGNDRIVQILPYASIISRDDFIVYFAAKHAGVPEELIDELPLADFNRVYTEVSGFF